MIKRSNPCSPTSRLVHHNIGVQKQLGVQTFKKKTEQVAEHNRFWTAMESASGLQIRSNVADTFAIAESIKQSKSLVEVDFLDR